MDRLGVDEDGGADAQNPGADNQCEIDADCSTPTSICETAEGATCVEGGCNYPEIPCDTPPRGRCIDGGTTLVRPLPNGTCSEDVGGCIYDEESIVVDPANCEALAADCEAVECPDTDCALNGSIDPQSLACECTYQTFLGDDQACEDITTLCFAQSMCNGEGGCESQGELLAAGERCLFFGEPVEALDSAGLPRALDSDEVRDLVAIPFCEGSSGRCIECGGVAADNQCDDENPCTQDRCNDGLCENLIEPLENADCILPGGGGFFGPDGFCSQGTCLQCDSTLTDSAVRDAACGAGVCLEGATCVNNQCEYDFFDDPAQGVECIQDSGEAGFCSLGTCVECSRPSQCLPPGADPICVDTSCENNECEAVILVDLQCTSDDACEADGTCG